MCFEKVAPTSGQRMELVLRHVGSTHRDRRAAVVEWREGLLPETSCGQIAGHGSRLKVREGKRLTGQVLAREEPLPCWTLPTQGEPG